MPRSRFVFIVISLALLANSLGGCTRPSPLRGTKLGTWSQETAEFHAEGFLGGSPYSRDYRVTADRNPDGDLVITIETESVMPGATISIVRGIITSINVSNATLFPLGHDRFVPVVEGLESRDSASEMRSLSLIGPQWFRGAEQGITIQRFDGVSSSLINVSYSCENFCHSKLQMGVVNLTFDSQGLLPAMAILRSPDGLAKITRLSDRHEGIFSEIVSQSIPAPLANTTASVCRLLAPCEQKARELSFQRGLQILESAPQWLVYNHSVTGLRPFQYLVTRTPAKNGVAQIEWAFQFQDSGRNITSFFIAGVGVQEQDAGAVYQAASMPSAFSLAQQKNSVSLDMGLEQCQKFGISESRITELKIVNLDTNSVPYGGYDFLLQVASPEGVCVVSLTLGHVLSFQAE